MIVVIAILLVCHLDKAVAKLGRVEADLGCSRRNGRTSQGWRKNVRRNATERKILSNDRCDDNDSAVTRTGRGEEKAFGAEVKDFGTRVVESVPR
jgi:hypothetical protein